MKAECFVVLATVAVAAALAGCGTSRSVDAGRTQPWFKPGMAPPVSDLESLLLYFEYINDLSEFDVGREREGARVAFTNERSDFNRVRLAMAVSLPDSGLGAEPETLDLLDPVVKNDGAPLRGLASLVSAQLRERRRLQGNVQSLQKKVQRLQKSTRDLTRKLDSQRLLQKSMDERDQALQQSVEELQQKLEALKSLDKSLIERERVTPPTKP